MSSPKNSPKVIAWVIYLYMWLLFAGLPVVVYMRHTSQREALPIEWALHGMFPNEIGEPLTLALYVLGIGLFFAAAAVPALMRNRLEPNAPMNRRLMPYIVRLTLIECGVLMGFVTAILREKPLAIAPFLLIGAMAMLKSPPPPAEALTNG